MTSASISAKMVAFAPSPSARLRTISAVMPGRAMSARSA
jgi:hypothetical protein